MTQPDLGIRLRQAGFLPLPLADNNGNLIGTHLWRARGPDLVECLQLYHSGLALAVRAVAGSTTTSRATMATFSTIASVALRTRWPGSCSAP